MTEDGVPEPADVTATRVAYDTVARDYAALLRDALAADPIYRGFLATFAALTVAAPVADIGCGPGLLTSHLAGLGLDVVGLDLSPGMLAVARRDQPTLRFGVADMAALPLPDGGLGGALLSYSLIHVTRDRRPRVFAELARVLRPGASLLLAFQVGDETLHKTTGYGHAVTYDVHRLPPDEIAAGLAAAGLPRVLTTIRARSGKETTDQCYLLAERGGVSEHGAKPALAGRAECGSHVVGARPRLRRHRV